jgi:hypothetical protein
MAPVNAIEDSGYRVMVAVMTVTSRKGKTEGIHDR